jgi:uncharacterized protein (DUF2126 family)
MRISLNEADIKDAVVNHARTALGISKPMKVKIFKDPLDRLVAEVEIIATISEKFNGIKNVS